MQARLPAPLPPHCRPMPDTISSPMMQCGAQAIAARCIGHRSTLRGHMQRTASFTSPSCQLHRHSLLEEVSHASRLLPEGRWCRAGLPRHQEMPSTTVSEAQRKCPTNLYIQAAGHHHNSSITNSLSLTPHYFTRRTAHCQKPGGRHAGCTQVSCPPRYDRRRGV